MDSLFIPGIQPALKHPTVFKTFDALQNGESFVLINDHDPIPLFYEMKAERGEVFEWKKIENGPEVWKVEIQKKGISTENKSEMKESTTAATEDFELNVTLIEPKFKHPTIFRHFDELPAGASFRILNDHDPKPLYYQLIAERGNIFSWEYLEKGPIWWKVRIRKNDVAAGETVGQIAAKDMRKAEVFKKYGIDFCCGGKKSLKQVCEESGLDAAVIEAELDSVQTKPQTGENFDRWEPDFLADYIYNKHHRYYYDEAPVITDLMAKVAARHGSHYPELVELQGLYKTLSAELDTHFMKEEKVLFPFIKALTNAKKTGSTTELYNGFSITQPVQMMESDHEAAGEILLAMRKLTNDYTLPADACNSYQFLFQKLRDLEADLHQHIHLENNILFPKALSLDKELRP